MRPPNNNNYSCSIDCRVGDRLEEIKFLIDKKINLFWFLCIAFRVMNFFFLKKKLLN